MKRAASCAGMVLQVCWPGSSAITYVLGAERALAIEATLLSEPRFVRTMLGVCASARARSCSWLGFSWTLVANAPTSVAWFVTKRSADMDRDLLAVGSKMRGAK